MSTSRSTVSFEDDRGGNEVDLSGGLCSGDLHAVWDRCIIEKALGGDVRSLARGLLDEVTNEDRAAWQASDRLGERVLAQEIPEFLPQGAP